MASSALDLRELEAELSRTKKKVTDWARNRQTVAADRRDLHMWAMQDQSEKIRYLQNQQTQLVAAADQVHARVENEHREVQSLQETCSTASTEKATAVQKLTTAQTSLSVQQQEYAKRIASINYDERSKTKKLEALQKAVEMFSNRLGLTFKRGTDGSFQLIFTHICMSKPSQEYMFAVRIDGPNDTYTVTRCEPAVPALPALQAELNSNLNFAWFVKEMRKRFVEMANPQ